MNLFLVKERAILLDRSGIASGMLDPHCDAEGCLNAPRSSTPRRCIHRTNIAHPSGESQP